MIECQNFYQVLSDAGLEFYAGVPDSLLKNFCFFVDDHLSASKHIITANEGSAVGIATGYHLATGKIPVVYLQNSGIGNTINPLLSIADPEVYSIPMLLIVGWRGEPGVKDEPQHKKQGKVMLEMLRSMDLSYEIIDGTSDYKKQIQNAVSFIQEKSRPFVFAVREGTFGEYKFKGGLKNDYSLTREEAINYLLDSVKPQDAIICTTGKASRELHELRIKHSQLDRADFLTVGAMGHTSQIALGVALQKPEKKIFCFDGDGSVLMHMGGLSTIGRLAPKNFIHVMINNGAHESVGGQDTGAFEISWEEVTKACGYKHYLFSQNKEDLKKCAQKLQDLEGPVFFEIRTSQGSRKDLGRPKSTPIENKLQFMKAL